MAFPLCHRPLLLSFASPNGGVRKQTLRQLRCSSVNQTAEPLDARKLVLEVKNKLEKEHSSLPVGKNGRDDEDMILWFLKDRKFVVEDAVTKLTKAIKWREDFGVSTLSEDSVKSTYATGKAYMHDFTDVKGRPVLVVVASKHFPEIDAFYNYYPKRLGQVLLVAAPFIFQPIWQLLKPLMKSYAALVRFCDAETVRSEYFQEDTMPAAFKG